MSVGDDVLNGERVHCFHLYKKYVREIFARMKQFKHELLVSCLSFLLALPKQLVVANMSACVRALHQALELGIGYLPIAETALASLEYWLVALPPDALRPHYPLIMAKFDDYLQKNKALGDTSGADDAANNRSSSSSIANANKFKYKRRRVLIATANSNNSGGGGGENDFYELIQYRMLRIVGKLAGQMSQCIFEAGQGTGNEQLLVAWDTVAHLRFAVPFVDMKPSTCILSSYE